MQERTKRCRTKRCRTKRGRTKWRRTKRGRTKRGRDERPGRLARVAVAALIALTAAVTEGCEADVEPVDPCIEPSVQIPTEQRVATDKLDLLLMIDNSGGMREQQSSLATEIPRLVEALTSGVGPNGTSFPPLADLRVGIVTSDMGTGGFTISTCDEPNFGDDGILQSNGAGGFCTGIPDDLPPYLGFRPAEGGNATAFGAEAACITNVGTTGCGFEQPLEAVLKSLTPSSSALRFVGGSAGHGDGANEGFLRDDSLVAIVMLSDEDDCSASNPDLFNRFSAAFTDPDLNLRCWRYGEPTFGAVHPVERYVDGLLALVEPERLLFSLIAGIPADLAHAPGESPDYPVLVGPEGVRDPRMVERTDPLMPSQLVLSCRIPGSATAHPPVRMVGVAEGLQRAGAVTVVQSICQGSYAGPVDAILEGIGSMLTADCLPRPLPQDDEGRVTCDLVEVLEGRVPEGEPLSDITCDDLPGRVFRELDERGRQVCTVCQTDGVGNVIDESPACQTLDGAAGWFYESGVTTCPADRPQAVAFSSGANPQADSITRLECRQERGAITVGTDCARDAEICAFGSLYGFPTRLICKAETSTCQLGCRESRDCAAAGLTAHECVDLNDDGESYCVNTSCEG